MTRQLLTPYQSQYYTWQLTRRAARYKQYGPFTARRAIIQEFTPSTEKKELSGLMADYLRRPLT